MAVELHRSRELILCSSSPRQFQLPQTQNDVVLDDDHGSLDLDFSDKLFDETQKPWDFEPDSSVNSDLIGSSESETEKTKDDCIAEFTRHMAPQFIPDHDKPNQSWDFGGWSCTTKIWSPFGSSYGSSEEGPSQETTPPTTPAIEKRHYSSWDSHDITAHMERLNIERPKYPLISKDRFCQSQASPTDIDHRIHAIQFNKMKQQRSTSLNKVMINSQNDNKIYEGLSELNSVRFGKREEAYPCVTERARQLPRQHWASHRGQAAGAGMRAVFLDRSGSKTGASCGTGVFLPCVIGDTSHSHKKKGCSPVLIPAKVMQALKAHFDRMDNLSPHNKTSPYNFPLQHDNTKSYAPKFNANGISYSEKKRQSRAVPATTQNDIGLPQDWTY